MAVTVRGELRFYDSLGFPKGDFQHPLDTVLDAPMLPSGPEQLFRVRRKLGTLIRNQSSYSLTVPDSL